MGWRIFARLQPMKGGHYHGQEGQAEWQSAQLQAGGSQERSSQAKEQEARSHASRVAPGDHESQCGHEVRAVLWVPGDSAASRRACLCSGAGFDQQEASFRGSGLGSFRLQP